MKKHILLTAGLLLASPFVLAQQDPANKPKPATPAVPDVGLPSTPPEVTPPTTDDQGNTSTGVRSQNGALGATANKDKKSGALSGEFAAMDVNGDGGLSRDEYGNMKGGLSFEQLDKNHDGKLNSIELKAAGNPQSGQPNDTSSPADKVRDKLPGR